LVGQYSHELVEAARVATERESNDALAEDALILGGFNARALAVRRVVAGFG
jgi:hypothetical protein